MIITNISIQRKAIYQKNDNQARISSFDEQETFFP